MSKIKRPAELVAAERANVAEKLKEATAALADARGNLVMAQDRFDELTSVLAEFDEHIEAAKSEVRSL